MIWKLVRLMILECENLFRVLVVGMFVDMGYYQCCEEYW